MAKLLKIEFMVEVPDKQSRLETENFFDDLIDNAVPDEWVYRRDIATEE